MARDAQSSRFIIFFTWTKCLITVVNLLQVSDKVYVFTCVVSTQYEHRQWSQLLQRGHISLEFLSTSLVFPSSQFFTHLQDS